MRATLRELTSVLLANDRVFTTLLRNGSSSCVRIASTTLVNGDLGCSIDGFGLGFVLDIVGHVHAFVWIPNFATVRPLGLVGVGFAFDRAGVIVSAIVFDDEFAIGSSWDSLVFRMEFFAALIANLHIVSSHFFFASTRLFPDEPTRHLVPVDCPTSSIVPPQHRL